MLAERRDHVVLLAIAGHTANNHVVEYRGDLVVELEFSHAVFLFEKHLILFHEPHLRRVERRSNRKPRDVPFSGAPFTTHASRKTNSRTRSSPNSSAQLRSSSRLINQLTYCVA